MENKYTARDFFKGILSNPSISAVERAYAEAAIAKLDERNEKRKNTPNKTQVANEPVKAAILAYLGEHARAVASDIAAACGVSTQKVSALCKQLVEAGAVSVADVKVKGKGTLKAYSLGEDAE